MTGILSLVDQDSYHSWQSQIIFWRENHSSKKATAGRQQQLQGAVTAGPLALSHYMMRVLGIDAAGIESLAAIVPGLPNRLTDDEMGQLPIHAETEIAAALDDVSRAEAAQPCFWYACHASGETEGHRSSRNRRGLARRP